MNTYEFEHAQIVRELLILNSIFIASPQNNKLVSESKKIILPIRFTEWEIIQEYLISTAIKLRIIDDKFINSNFKDTLKFEGIGDFLSEKGVPTSKIDLRKACNKIVHARKFEIQESVEVIHLEPAIILIGTQWDKKIKGMINWKVELDIQKYVCAGLAFIKTYEENPSIN